MLGKETIDSFNTSETKGNSPSYGRNFQKMGKDLMSVDNLVLLYQLLHRSYKKHWKYSVFWLLGTAVKMGFSVTSKKATTYTGTFCPKPPPKPHKRRPFTRRML